MSQGRWPGRHPALAPTLAIWDTPHSSRPARGGPSVATGGRPAKRGPLRPIAAHTRPRPNELLSRFRGYDDGQTMRDLR